MPWSMRTEGGQVLVVRQRDKKVVGRHKDRKRALAQLRVLSSLEKAQFASRSEAGRYAANMRWQGQGKTKLNVERYGDNKQYAEVRSFEIDGKKFNISKGGDSPGAGMYNGYMAAFDNGKNIGYIDYHLDSAGKKATVAMIFVEEGYRRQGIAEALLDSFITENPSYEVSPGYTTEEGEKWWRSVIGSDGPITGLSRLETDALDKAQFASRSEAGRYAANQRWKGQGKKEQKSTKSPLAKRLLEAESSLKQKGFKTAVIGLKVGEEKYEKFLKSVYKIVGEQRKSLNPDDFSNKEWNEISRAYHYMQMASPDMQTMKRFGISAKRPDNVIVIYGKDKEVAGVMSFQILEELFHGAKGPKNSEKIGRGVFSRPVMDLELAGSSHKHKGVGSALFAQAVRTASKNNLGLRLTSHINAESFWESVGFKAEGSNSDGMKIYRLSEKEVKDLAKSLGSGGSNDFKP